MTSAMNSIRSLASVLAALLLLGATPSLAADGAFLAEVDDLPLAPGLVEQPGGTLFDAPQGRIVEANAEGKASADAVRAFYEKVLPQLGWNSEGDLAFAREKERLKIEIDGSRTPVAVHFAITPRAKADAADAGEKTQ